VASSSGDGTRSNLTTEIVWLQKSPKISTAGFPVSTTLHNMVILDCPMGPQRSHRTSKILWAYYRLIGAVAAQEESRETPLDRRGFFGHFGSLVRSHRQTWYGVVHPISISPSQIFFLCSASIHFSFHVGASLSVRVSLNWATILGRFRTQIHSFYYS
jgi:hypothetical protein